ncbi:MAG TPA: DUF3037 domain-containing protein [Candidatus Limnocylindrales bacterium]
MPGRRDTAGTTDTRSPFEYAIIRVVPRVERGEAFNAGIVLMSRPRRFLGARTELDPAVLAALSPDCDPETVREHLSLVDRIAAGDETAGPIAALPAHERFHWLVSPSSTMIQPSPVHTGLTADPAATLDHLFRTLVRRA